MRRIRSMGGDAAPPANFSVTLERAGTIQTIRRHNHRCVFWKPTMLRMITNPEVVSKVTVKQAIRNPPGRLANTVPCKPYDEQGQETATSLGGIDL
jgi:hypothetical protein